MSTWDGWRHRLRVWLRPRAYDREMAEEQAFHLSLAAMQQEHAGRGDVSPADALAAARRRYGNLTNTREDARHMAGLSTLEMVRQDVLFALLLRPLPFTEPERLMKLQAAAHRR